MGLIKGTTNLTRYRVEGEPPHDYLEKYPRMITRYAFRGIAEDALDERSAGWVDIMDVFKGRLGGHECLKYPFIALAFRIDEKKVPEKAVKHYSREAEEEILAAENLDYLPGSRRKEIKAAVRGKLLKRAIPRSNTYDMSWNLETGTVMFGALGNKTCDEFTELFYHTFGLRLNAVFPYTLACSALLQDDMDPNILESLGEADFAEGS